VINRRSPREIECMRQAGAIVAEVLERCRTLAVPGITTEELDQKADALIRERNAIPLFKGYRGYPKSICASVNEEVVHGIPGLRKLENGDIISIDIGAVYHGYVGDASMTFPVGEISAEASRLLQVTRQSLFEGIGQAIPGNRIGDISAAIQQFVEAHGYQVVRDFVGHGVGARMHEEPQVPNFGKAGMGPRLQPGMTIAIEPMVNVGTYEVMVMPNRWTAVTRDHSLSAHFEHTVLIAGGQPEILTQI